MATPKSGKKRVRVPNTSCESCRKPLYVKPKDLAKSHQCKPCYIITHTKPTICVVCGTSFPTKRRAITCSEKCDNINRGQSSDFNRSRSNRRPSDTFVDLTGKRFGRLTVIKLNDVKPGGRRKVQWVCKCDCGEERIYNPCTLKSGTVVSCGCYRRENAAKLKLEAPWMISRNRVVTHYRYAAKRQEREFSLTDEQCFALLEGNCHYCGVVPSNITNVYFNKDGTVAKGRANRPRNREADYAYNGIDRKEGDVGYTAGNCVSCCEMCNFAKRVSSYDDFIDWLDRAATFWSNKAEVRNTSSTNEHRVPSTLSRLEAPWIVSRNKVISGYRYHAGTRGLEFLLTEDECVSLFEGNCHYCGTKPSNTLNAFCYKDGTVNKHGGTPPENLHDADYIYSGIDRKDSDQGYSSKNCVSCCIRCNFAKNNMAYEDFVAWFKRAAEFRLRAGHVQTTDHWMLQAITPNKVKSEKDN